MICMQKQVFFSKFSAQIVNFDDTTYPGYDVSLSICGIPRQEVW